MREWLGRHNPYAMEEIARKMLELYTRGKYHPAEEVLEKLKENYLLQTALMIHCQAVT